MLSCYRHLFNTHCMPILCEGKQRVNNHAENTGVSTFGRGCSPGLSPQLSFRWKCSSLVDEYVPQGVPMPFTVPVGLLEYNASKGAYGAGQTTRAIVVSVWMRSTVLVFQKPGHWRFDAQTMLIATQWVSVGLHPCGYSFPTSGARSWEADRGDRLFLPLLAGQEQAKINAVPSRVSF